MSAHATNPSAEIPEAQLAQVQQAADRARQGAAHEQAIDLYTQALAQPDVPWEAHCAMTLARAESRQMLGDTAALDAELTTLAEQAAARGDDAVRATALAEVAMSLRVSGDLARSLRLGYQALEAAEKTGQPGLKVDALYVIGRAQMAMGDLNAAQERLQVAEALPLTPEDGMGQIKIAQLRDLTCVRTGDLRQALRASEQGLRLARAAGRRDWEGDFLNGIANSTPDLALQGSLMEQALAAFEALGDRPRQSMMLQNTSSLLIVLGLYERAAEVARQALQMAQAMRQDNHVIYSLQFLGLALSETGDLPAAQACLDEGLALAQSTNSRFIEVVLILYKALIMQYQGHPQQALEQLQRAALLSGSFPSLFQANRLAYQAAASRLAGDEAEARRLAEQAVALITPSDFGNPEIIVEELYWWCYRALAPKDRAPAGEPISDERWQILDLGRQALLTPVENMSDAGLRRGYLHRVRFRRLLVQEWLRHAPGRTSAEELAAFAAQVQRPGRLNDVFQRLLKVGVRLNAQRDVSRLPGEIVDEVAELTGAERSALVLYGPQGGQRMAEVKLPRPPYPAMSGTVEAPPDPQAFLAEIVPWLEEAAATRQGFVRLLNPDGELAEQRSVLVAPLVSQGRLVGVIYTDLTGCFGRFEPEDLDLLGVLANQSAVAIENADWSATLEHKVAERTAELDQSTRDLQASNRSLEQRNAELAIINSIQQGIAAEMDFQAIVDLVGDKLREVFNTRDLTISWYHEKDHLLHYLYCCEHGERLRIPPRVPTPGGLFETMSTARQPAGVAALVADGLPGGRGRQRHRGHPGGRAPTLRRDPDGRADARDGRAGSNPGDLQPLALGHSPAHHRHDRECYAGRP